MKMVEQQSLLGAYIVAGVAVSVLLEYLLLASGYQSYLGIDELLVIVGALLAGHVSLTNNAQFQGVYILFPVFLFLLFSLFVSLLSEVPPMSLSRSLQVCTITVVLACLLSLIPISERDLSSAFFYLSASGVMVFILTFPLVFFGGELFSEDLISMYMHGGEVSAILSVVACHRACSRERKTFLNLLGFILGLVGLVLSGSRGSLLFAFAICMLIVFSRLRFSRLAFWSLVAGLCFVVAMLFIEQSLISGRLSNTPLEVILGRSEHRFLSIFSGDAAQTRFVYFDFVANNLNIKTLVFGNGLGSFGPSFLGIDAYMYPHNFLLQALYEHGILFVIFIVGLLVYRVYHFRRNNNFIAICLLLLMTLLLLKSSSLWGAKVFWIFLFMRASSNFPERA